MNYLQNKRKEINDEFRIFFKCGGIKLLNKQTKTTTKKLPYVQSSNIVTAYQIYKNLIPDIKNIIEDYKYQIEQKERFHRVIVPEFHRFKNLDLNPTFKKMGYCDVTKREVYVYFTYYKPRYELASTKDDIKNNGLILSIERFPSYEWFVKKNCFRTVHLINLVRIRYVYRMEDDFQNPNVNSEIFYNRKNVVKFYRKWLTRLFIEKEKAEKRPTLSKEYYEKIATLNIPSFFDRAYEWYLFGNSAITNDIIYNDPKNDSALYELFYYIPLYEGYFKMWYPKTIIRSSCCKFYRLNSDDSEPEDLSVNWDNYGWEYSVMKK